MPAISAFALQLHGKILPDTVATTAAAAWRRAEGKLGKTSKQLRTLGGKVVPVTLKEHETI